jgi:peptidoglycan/LPS O-acetylase OafA/YrhL
VLFVFFAVLVANFFTELVERPGRKWYRRNQKERRKSTSCCKSKTDFKNRKFGISYKKTFLHLRRKER